MKTLFTNYLVAVICEGNTEETLLDILLEADQLCFRQTDLLNRKILGPCYRCAKRFQEDFLRYDYDEKELAIVMIHDNKCGFTLRRPYRDKISGIYWVLTRPEIEMLMIHHYGFYEDYKKTYRDQKPSEFLANRFKMKSSLLKSSSFIRQVFDSEKLINAIREYDRNAPKKYRGEYGLIDLLKREF